MLKLYCKKCGFEIEKDWKFCPKCKTVLQSENIETNKDVIIEQHNQKNINSFICLCIFLISIVTLFTVDKYKWISFIISLISIVTGYIKYPNNKIIKILFWLFLIGVVICILLILIIIFTCGETLSRWDCAGLG